MIRWKKANISNSILVIGSFLIFLVIFVKYCAPSLTPKVHERKITNIERILNHEGTRYTFWVKNQATKTLKPVETNCYYNQTARHILIEDVKENQSDWAIWKYSGQSGGCTTLSLEIHVHSAKEIQGGGWNHGKFGSGQTTVVE